MNERIKKVRKKLGLSQEEFANRIGLNSKATISLIEKGTSSITERFIKQVCTEFKVNEYWLRSGNGDIFLQPSENNIADLINEQGLSPIIEEILKAYFRIDKEEREMIFDGILEKIKTRNTNSQISDYRADLHEQIDKQLDEAEKRDILTGA
ncbi:hypothetical protein AGMMS49975_24360 [Clostridia bacterium]|nr:hypothetical protein AGMMS49975_24360 [Clostridia bacterium]